MIRTLAIVFCAYLWMGIFVSGMLVCLDDPYVEHSCFTGENFEYFLKNKAWASEQCLRMNCCWNETLARCYSKSHMRALTPTNRPYQSNNMPQDNTYVHSVNQAPQQQNWYPSNHYQQPSYNPNNIQVQPSYVPPAQHQNRYSYQQQHQNQNPYASQNQYPNYQPTNQQQNQYQPSQYELKPNYPRQPQGQQPGLSQYSSQYGRPTQKTPSNKNKLLTALGLPTEKPSYIPQHEQGPMGTSILHAIPKQNAGGSLFDTINRCSLANSIMNEASRTQFQSMFGCKGTEPTIPPDQAEALLKDVLGGTGQPIPTAPTVVTQPAVPATPRPKVSPQLTFPVLPPAKSVGGRLPTFGVQNYRAPPTNARICLMLNSLTSNIASIMKFQYRCGATGNGLLDLATGNSPKGLGSIPSIISLFGITADAPVVTTISEGSINPNLVPSDILSKCISNRYTYPSCRSGYDVNINTESECFNEGCLFFKDTYGTRCFRCDLVPASAYRLQDSADTCTVATTVQCDGFLAFQITVASIDMRGKNNQLVTTPAPNPFASLFSSNPTLSALLQSNPSLLSSLGSNPGLSALLRSGALSTPRSRQLNLASLLPFLTGSSAAGGSSATTNLLLNSITGGGSTSTSTGLLLSALTGGTSLPAATFPKLSAGALANLKSTCQTKGCCWQTDTTNRLGGTCFKKGVTFPTSCLPTPDSGTCGKSLDVNDLQRVAGGVSIASATSRPWMAMIQQITNGVATFKCGGVQICAQWIMTTASCLQRKDDLTNSFLRVPNINPATIRVFVGTLTPAVPGPEVDVEKIILHPGYNTLQSYNDIALLKIRSIAFSAANSPVCLPPLKSAAPAAEQVLYFTGYGKSTANGLADFTSLRELPFTVKDATHCNTIYPGTVLPKSGIFCAESSSGTDTCYGDGGSPVVLYDAVKNVFTLYGINFGGSDQCDGSKPALFTSIINFMPWIAQSTNGCCNIPSSRYV